MNPRAEPTSALAAAGEQSEGLRDNYWHLLGHGLFCPLAVTDAPGHLSVFARSAAGELVRRRWGIGGWGSLNSFGVPCARRGGAGGSVGVDWQLSGCPGGERIVLLFGRSPDGEVLYQCVADDPTGDFDCLGAPSGLLRDIEVPLGIAGPPAVCADADGGVDLFATSYDGQLLHATRRGGVWSDFEALGPATVRVVGGDHPVPLPAMLAACRSGQDLGVFARGPAGDLLMKWCRGNRWAEWISLGCPELPDPLYPAVTVPAPLSSYPAACSWGPNRLDVFARGAAGDMLHRWWDGSEWSRFESLGMPVTGDLVALPFTGTVTACTWGADRLDVFGRALDGGLYHARFDGRWDRGATSGPERGGDL